MFTSKPFFITRLTAVRSRLFASLALFAAFGAATVPAHAGFSDLMEPGTATKTKDDAAVSKMPERGSAVVLK
jgi:hypothetical protein